jgi:ABC-type polysaccharide/polyol phosphate transport system ATPase subunit
MDLIKNVCDRAMLMRGGRSAFSGQPDEVLSRITEEERQEMLAA